MRLQWLGGSAEVLANVHGLAELPKHKPESLQGWQTNNMEVDNERFKPF